MGAVRGWSASARSRLSTVWHTDLSDPTAMAALRARVFQACLLLGLLTEIGGAVATRATVRSAWLVHAGTIGWIVGTWLWALRGARLGDREYLGLMLGVDVFAAASVAATVGVGDVAVTALGLITPTLQAAMFCGRRRDVAVHAVLGSALLSMVAVLGGGGLHAFQEVIEGAFDLVVLAAVVRLLRDVAAEGVRRARVGEVTDPLTGLANRRGMEQLGGPAWVERARRQGAIAMLVIDVDHFKQINDTLGHAGGDDVLRRLAELLSGSLRGDDIAVRLGGEEFLLLCSVPPGHAPVIAERLRARVEEQLGVTVSIGVHEVLAAAAEDLPATLWSAVDVADQAMYAAKNSGRNRVVLA